MDIDITGNNAGSAGLTLNLQTYLEAYHNGTDEEFIQARMELLSLVKNGELHFNELANNAGIPQDFENEVRRSAAYIHTSRQFVEILKNSVDVKLKEQANGLEPNECILELNVDFSAPGEDLVNITIADNGSGFPVAILSKIATKEIREQSDYYHQTESEKRQRDNPKRKLYIGGAGRGTRELMGLIDKGDHTYGSEGNRGPLEEDFDSLHFADERTNKQTFVIPEVSDLIFSNRTGETTGAVIDIVTTNTPLIAHQQKETQAPTLSLVNKRFKAPPKKPTSTSPISVQDIENDSPNTKQNTSADSTTQFRKNVSRLTGREEDDFKDDDNFNMTNK